MFKALVLVIGLFSTLPAAAAVYRLEPAHTEVRFSYRPLGLGRASARIAATGGTLRFDPDQPGDSAVDVRLDMASLATGSASLDDHLRGDGYFDVARYPQATFRSTNVVMTGATTANVTGDLTLHGITRGVTLAVVFRDDREGSSLGFLATARVNRSAFGMSGMPLVADAIDLHIEALARP